MNEKPEGERRETQAIRLLSKRGCEVRYLLDGHDETITFTTGNDAAKAAGLINRVEAALRAAERQPAHETPPKVCNWLHPSTGAMCELPPGHIENHRGRSRHVIVQWPNEPAQGAAQPTNRV